MLPWRLDTWLAGDGWDTVALFARREDAEEFATWRGFGRWQVVEVDPIPVPSAVLTAACAILNAKEWDALRAEVARAGAV